MLQWETVNRRRAYPFVQPATPLELRQYLVDASIVRTASADIPVHRIILLDVSAVPEGVIWVNSPWGLAPVGEENTGLGGFLGFETNILAQEMGSTWNGYQARIVLDDGDGDPDFITPMFDSQYDAHEFYANTYGPWSVLRWTAEALSVTLLLYAPAHDDIIHPILVDNGILAERCVTIQPGAVTQIVVRNVLDVQYGEPAVLGSVSGNIQVAPGFNVLGEADPEDTDLTQADVPGPSGYDSTLRVGAVPGSGSGRYVDCGDVQYIRSLNGMPPDEHGNVNISGDGCYWVERPGDNDGGSVQTAANLLQLRGGCGACCECADYWNAYKAIIRLWDRLRVAADRLNVAHAEYMQAVQEWSDRPITSGCDRLIVQLLPVPKPGWVCGFRIIASNGLGCDLTGIDLTLTWSITNGGPGSILVPGSTYRYEQGLTPEAFSAAPSSPLVLSRPGFTLYAGRFWACIGTIHVTGTRTADVTGIDLDLTGSIGTQLVSEQASALFLGPFNRV